MWPKYEKKSSPEIRDVTSALMCGDLHVKFYHFELIFFTLVSL